MKKRSSVMLLVLVLIISSINVAFAGTMSKNDHALSKLNDNYEKAMEDLSNIIDLDKENLSDRKINFLSPNLKQKNTNSNLEYIQTFEENNTTLLVSENDYAIASMDGDELVLIEYVEGKKTESRVNFANLLSKIEEKSEKSENKALERYIAPFSFDYTNSEDSMFGYYEYYEMRSTNNYRMYELTVPRTNETLKSHSRATSSSTTQSFERSADRFLTSLYSAQDLYEEACDIAWDLAKESFYFFVDLALPTDEARLAVNITIALSEVYGSATESGYAAALITALQEAGSMLFEETIGAGLDFVDNVKQSYTLLLYRGQFRAMQTEYNNFIK